MKKLFLFLIAMALPFSAIANEDYKEEIRLECVWMGDYIDSYTLNGSHITGTQTQHGWIVTSIEHYPTGIEVQLRGPGGMLKAVIFNIGWPCRIVKFSIPIQMFNRR